MRACSINAARGQQTNLTPSLRDGRLIARPSAWIDTGARSRYVRLMALTLRNGWYAMGSRWIGPHTQRASTIRPSVTLSMPGEGCGQEATLSRGYSARVSDKAGDRVAVRTMRTRILESDGTCGA